MPRVVKKQKNNFLIEKKEKKTNLKHLRVSCRQNTMAGIVAKQKFVKFAGGDSNFQRLQIAVRPTNRRIEIKNGLLGS